MYNGFVYINDVEFPYPSAESGLQHTVTTVDSARMADGVLRAKKIGRDQSKVELTWAALKPEQWSKMLKIFDENFYFNIRYFDMVQNDWITRRFYVGDRSAQPFMVDKETGRPRYWLNCQANVIDTGEEV
jgi:hypothetical protein